MSTGEMEVTGAVTERLFGSLLGALELATVHLGVRLGLYDALATPRTAAALAQASGIDERYAREWLEQQAISGLVTVVEAGDAQSRVYGLDHEQAASFGDPESPAYAGSMALLMGGVAAVVDDLPDVYRSGSGIAFGGYGDDVRLGQGLFNRAGFLGQLTQEWLPAFPGVTDLLSRPGARALDLGCGVGWSSIALATAYPGLAGARDRQRRRLGDGRACERRREPGSATGCVSRWPTPLLRPARVASTWRSTSRPCTTWPTRSSR